MPAPLRGEIWMIDLDPTRGHEQAGKRPALVISDDLFNGGPAGLVIVLPLTSKPKSVRTHVAVQPPEGGLRKPSFIKCEDVRSVSVERLEKTPWRRFPRHNERRCHAAAYFDGPVRLATTENSRIELNRQLLLRRTPPRADSCGGAPVRQWRRPRRCQAPQPTAPPAFGRRYVLGPA